VHKGNVAGEGIDVFEELAEADSSAEVEIW
jgi:hypothetical protein